MHPDQMNIGFSQTVSFRIVTKMTYEGCILDDAKETTIWKSRMQKLPVPFCAVEPQLTFSFVQL